MKTLFISGTNTGIGKTVAAAWLCRELSNSGKRCAYVKAVQTGGYPDISGGLVSVDLEYVKASAPELVASFCGPNFLLPASPHLAAEQEQRSIELNSLTSKLKAFSDSLDLDFLIIEGAGGLAVPLNDEHDMLDLCVALKAQLILVTTTGLGTLNHTKLSHLYAQSKLSHEPLIIINRASCENPLIEADNIKLIKGLSPCLAILPHQADLDTEGSSPLSPQFKAELNQLNLLNA